MPPAPQRPRSLPRVPRLKRLRPPPRRRSIGCSIGKRMRRTAAAKASTSTARRQQRDDRRPLSRLSGLRGSVLPGNPREARYFSCASSKQKDRALREQIRAPCMWAASLAFAGCRAAPRPARCARRLRSPAPGNRRSCRDGCSACRARRGRAPWSPACGPLAASDRRTRQWPKFGNETIVRLPMRSSSFEHEARAARRLDRLRQDRRCRTRPTDIRSDRYRRRPAPPKDRAPRTD